MKPTPKISKKKPSDKTYAGFVAIIGAPNAGKSTLVNKIVGQKIVPVSPKAQTTRMRTLGLWSEGSTQIALVDTPGIFTPKRRLDHAMVEAAWESLEDADVIVWLVDASSRSASSAEDVINILKKQKRRVILVLNKIDQIELSKLLPLAEKLNQSQVVDETFMISALKGDGVEDLKAFLKSKMPKGPWLFPEDQLSDLPSRLLAAEITREQLYRQLQQELPYAATVLPETWVNKEDGSSVIHQTIIVTRPNHKAIVLGKNGSRIKSIGAAARKEIEQFLGGRAHLFLEVKVDEKWQDRPELYHLFGLNFGAAPSKKSGPKKF